MIWRRRSESLWARCRGRRLDLIEFAKAFVAAAWIKHFGAEMEAKDIVTVGDAPNVDDVWLPFFVEVPPAEVQGGGNA